jgi:hypothetical protein
VSNRLVWQVGNRNPSITEDIVDATGAAVDLTGATVKFKMRPVGSSTKKVDASATIVSAPLGQVRYDWTALDVDTAGDYLVWWEVTSGGKTQDVAEATIEFRAHAPEENAYVELEEVKSSKQLTGTSFADGDLKTAIVSASRFIDKMTGQFFYLGPPGEVRRYSPRRWSCHRIRIDPLVALVSLKTDPTGNNAFGDTWAVDTDFVLEPLNAALEDRPYDEIHVLSTGGFAIGFPPYRRSIQVTGQFGWLAVPAGVAQATNIIATRALKMAREAPWGVAALGPDGTAIRIAAQDPIVRSLLKPYDNRVLV